MPDPMLCDTHEPDIIFNLISQSIPCERRSINEEGYADYLWGDPANQHQVERKTWMELLSNLDSVEDQLRREAQAHAATRLTLLVEGVATSAGMGTSVWMPSKSTTKRIMFPGKEFRLPLQKAYAWLYQVSKYVEVHCTPDSASTATALVAFYKADQKGEHTTFNRYLRVIDFHPNPQIEGLMNIMRGSRTEPGIGAVRAEALIARFGTIWNVLRAGAGELAQVDGMGLKTAQQLLRKVGRPDV